MKKIKISPEDLKEMENLALWVNGSGPAAMPGTLQEVIVEQIRHPIETQLYHHRKRLSNYHTKTVKGKTYWYHATAEGWKYIGGEDPNPGTEKIISFLEKSLKEKIAAAESCVIKEVRERHLLIDLELFRKHVSKKLPERMIQISEILKIPG